MSRGDKLQGSLELLILRSVAGDALHGYAIAMRILAFSGGALSVEEGSLYPALHRLEKRRLLKAEWRSSDTGRRAKFYSLTTAGQEALEKELQSWEELNTGIRRFLHATGGPA